MSVSSRHRGHQPCLQLLVVAAWLGMTQLALGQTDDSSERLRVPVRILNAVQAQQAMMNFPGVITSATDMDPLAYYQRSRLGRWTVGKDVDPDDSVCGIEIQTAAGPIRIRYEVLIEGESFQAAREKTIDDLLEIAQGKVTEADEDEISKQKNRMVAYAKSRGERATRYELRRRVADLAGGPALLWTSQDFAAGRNETQMLFALLDEDENGVISAQEVERAGDAIENCDLDSDGRVELAEVSLRLKPRSPRRAASSAKFDWRTWNANESEHVEDLSVNISFTKEENKSKLSIDDCVLAEPWIQTTADLHQGRAEEPLGQAVLLSHPKVTIALTAAAENGATDLNQISVGVTSEGNSLFRHLDRDGDWSLTALEIRDLSERILDLDQNADGGLDVNELPTLLRVCVAQGAVVHRALNDGIAFVQASGDPSEPGQKLTAPAWFVSMDKDGDRTLTRNEFLGGGDAFNKMDADENKILSVAEALAVE